MNYPALTRAGASLSTFKKLFEDPTLQRALPVLTGLPACVVIPLQMIQNAAARLVFNQPKRAHVTH